MVYDLIKDKVSHISEELRLNPANILDVTIGGVIKEINPPIDLVVDSYMNEEAEVVEGVDLRGFYRLLVDDGVGELEVYISEEAYEFKKDFIEIDKICIFYGLTSTMTRLCNGQHHIEIRVYAYDVEPIVQECLF